MLHMNFLIKGEIYDCILPMTSNWYWDMGDFLESFIWLSMDDSKDNFKNNYLIFNPNYFISFLITTFFFYELF